MTPITFLVLAACITLGALVLDRYLRRRRRRELIELARQWRMHYVHRDVFDLTQRVARDFPIPGAALVRVTDLIYGVEGEFHRYIFSTEYTVGAVRVRKRLVRVVSTRDARSHSAPHHPPELKFSDDSLPLVEQYRTLHTELSSTAEAPPENEQDGARE